MPKTTSFPRLFHLMTAFCLGSALAADSDDNIFRGGDEMVQRVTKSLVSIYASPEGSKVSIQGKVQRGQGTGTGFFINDRGDIATAYHVVDHCKTVSVKLSDQKQYTADVVGYDAFIDVALIRIKENLPTEIAWLEWAKPSDLKVGQKVIAVGDPGRLRSTFTAGIVSTLHRTIQLQAVEDFIQTDAPINPGNSGGPLLNRDGQVVGINDAGSTDMKGIGYAVPTLLAKRTLEKIVLGARWIYPFLGLAAMEEDPFTKERGYQAGAGQGLNIIGVAVGSPAQKAGLNYGDTWTHVGDQPIRSFADAFIAMDEKECGKPVTISYLRNGTAAMATLQPVERPFVARFDPENFARVHLGFEIQKTSPGAHPEAPIYRIGKVFTWAEKKKDYAVKEGQWIMRLRPGPNGSIPEFVRDDEQFETLVYDFSLIDDDSRFLILMNLTDDPKGKGSWIYSYSQSHNTMF